MITNKFAGMAVAAATAAALVLTATACSSGEQEQATTKAAQTQTQAAETITEEQAKAAALKHANVNEKDATFTKVGLETDNGKQVYDLKFTAGNTEYDYDIDAVTGDVVGYDQEIIATSTAQQPAANANTNANAGAGAATSQDGYIGEDVALNKALEHAGIAADSITYQEVSLDSDDGIVKYDVEFHVGMTEYSYDIDATNGNVLSFESEIDD